MGVEDKKGRWSIELTELGIRKRYITNYKIDMPKLYFIQAEQLRYIKIGLSKEPFYRLRSLQQYSPDKLILLGIMYGDDILEETLHKNFRNSRVRGEWFLPTNDLLEYIKDNTIEPVEFYNRLFEEEKEISRSDKRRTLAQIAKYVLDR